MKKTLRIVLCFSSVLLFSFCAKLQAQQLKVSGTVKDTSGVGLPGISVTIKGRAAASTSTDLKGNYSLMVPNAKSVLVFSGVNMSAEEKVGNRTNIDVRLLPGSSSLDEVVVIGYGSQKKRDVTGAISSVGAKQIAERQAVDVYDALQGQTPGVQIAQESGRPGAESSIRIRGTSTFQAGVDPLYVVDGMQGVNIDGINPADIESIEVLRDAASAAIYGSKAANGVIIITTKKGKDGKARVDFRAMTAYGEISHKLPEANAADEMEIYAKRNVKFPGSADSLNPAYNNNNNYQDLITQTSVRNQVDLSVSGGSKSLSYFGSFGYLNDEGIIKNSWSKIGRGRFNIDYKPNDKFTFGTRFQGSYKTENQVNDGLLTAALERPPTFRVYYPDGSLAPPLGGSYDPLAIALDEKNNVQVYNASIYNYLSYNFSPALKFTVDAHLSFNASHNLQFFPAIISTAVPGIDSLIDSLNIATYWQVQGYFNYIKTIAQKHTFTGVLGVNADNGFYHNSRQAGDNLVNENVQTLNSAQIILPSSTNEARVFENSVYGRFGYSFMGRYLFNATARADGSSRFAEGHQWGYFPSASIGWRFSDENYMDWSRKVLDDGKLRVSYGTAGNDQVGNYGFLTQYVLGTNFYNGISGVAPSSILGNPNLTWETTTQLNVGADLAMLKGRLNVSVDAYNKTTRNLLYNAPLSENTGYQYVAVNFGSIRNTGVEFLINGYPVRNKTFTWNISYNMSVNNNRVLQLYNGASFLPFSGGKNLWKVSQGGHIGDYYGYKALGVYQSSQANAYTSDWQQLTPVFNNGSFTGYTLNGKPYSGTVQQLSTNGSTFQGGDVIWQNINKDSVIDDNDRVILGNAIPKWTGDLSNSFTYKQFTLTFNFYISAGNKLYNGLRANMDANTSSNTMPEPDYIHNAWFNNPLNNPNYAQYVNTNTQTPSATLNNPVQNGRDGSSVYVEDASFIRFRNVRFSYIVPRNLTSRFKVNTATVYVFGNNLATWTNYKGYDPEMSLNTVLTPGNDTGRYPRQKQVGVGINVTF